MSEREKEREERAFFFPPPLSSQYVRNDLFSSLDFSFLLSLKRGKTTLEI